MEKKIKKDYFTKKCAGSEILIDFIPDPRGKKSPDSQHRGQITGRQTPGLTQCSSPLLYYKCGGRGNLGFDVLRFAMSHPDPAF
jgi:hypothetical protein